MRKYVFFVEILATASIILGFFLSNQSIDFGQMMLLLGFVSLSLAFFIQAFLPLQLVDAKGELIKVTVILTKLIYLLLANAVLGAFFKLFAMDGWGSMLKTSLIGFIFLMVIFLLDWRMSQNPKVILHYRNLIPKALIVMSLAFLFFLTPKEKLARLVGGKVDANQPSKVLKP